MRNCALRTCCRLVAVATALLGAVPARADGAFPDGQAVLMRPDRPRQIILATTFGLVISEDDGARWAYGCETIDTQTGYLYSYGALPDGRLHGVSDYGAPVSVDDGCTWTLGSGLLAGATVTDVFPDPNRSTRVLAVALVESTENRPAAVFQSNDGGLTYDRRLFHGPAGYTITGVEIATGSPDTIYVTGYQQTDLLPLLARSTDGGVSWTELDLTAQLGPAAPYLVGIDPADPRKLYLRLVGPTGITEPYESLAISTDGGATWSVPVTITGGMLTAFLRRPGNGNALLLTTVQGSTSRGFRSSDGGRTFLDWPLTIHPRGLAERGGVLFAATDDFRDGFALGRSTDNGVSWSSVLRFREISSVRSCVRATCQSDCDYLAGLKLFPAETCNPVPAPPPAPDAGCGCGVVNREQPPDSNGEDGAGLLAATSILGLAAAGVALHRRQRRRRP